MEGPAAVALAVVMIMAVIVRSVFRIPCIRQLAAQNAQGGAGETAARFRRQRENPPRRAGGRSGSISAIRCSLPIGLAPIPPWFGVPRAH